MTDATLEILRQDALVRRLKNIGGNRILWSAKDAALITERVLTTPAKMLLRDMPAMPARKRVNTNSAVRRHVSAQGIVLRDLQPDDTRFLFIISSEAVDLAGDVIKLDGIDYSGYVRNPVVLNSHDNSALPVASSTSPLISGKALTAVAEFPPPGISECSDQTAAAVRAKLIKGASIGFIPVEWSFTKDPARAFGIDFHRTKLLEWSICSVPCNPDALLLGAVAGGKSARRSSRNAPLDDVGDEDSDWRCKGSDSMPLDISDDPYDTAAAKVQLLEKNSSPDGTILEEAAECFLAVDVASPLDANSFQFPFCRVTDGGIVAAKTGWRQSLAALENGNISGMPVSDARALVDRLEARIGDIKTAARRREASALVAKGRLIASSIGDDAPPTREQRIAEARNFRRALESRT